MCPDCDAQVTMATRLASPLRNVQVDPPGVTDMLGSVRSFISATWPFVGSVYLLYLALQPPPTRYVGLLGLVIVTPLLTGWLVGRILGIGPWATSDSEPPEDG